MKMIIKIFIIFCILIGMYTWQSKQKENEHKQVKPVVLAEKIPLEKQYANNIILNDGKQVIQNPANGLALVNKQFELPAAYIPSGLARADVVYSFGSGQAEKALMRKDGAAALEKMFAAASREGIELAAVSGYRSYTRQREVFQAEVRKNGEKAAWKVVAKPGQSEHQTGLTMDISSASNGYALSTEFEQTKEGKWLAKNAHLYGFILRYPKGKEQITGYSYEPWHFRYVGTKYADIMYKNKMTLEEFMDNVKSI
ncbi:D-alanyl-D-alanine carboxypeptidase family protein [Bacillus sp. 1P06AnD]|uniref:M15 family metallopeptidase n=1 Tax=Bacillus sp. 1P06AnD TaxID=3132208 RepID=UPI0039A3C5AD